jgi:hypothetical protein
MPNPYERIRAVALTRRARKFRPLTLQGKYGTYYNGQVIGETPFLVDIAEHQRTWSEGHSWPKGRGANDVGGPFETIRTRYNANFDLNKTFSFGSGGLIRYQYTGKVLPTILIPNALLASATDADLFSFVPSLGDPILGAKGATAISNSAPTNPVADSSVNVAELIREGLPSLIGASFLRGPGHGSAVKKVGGEYLNLQFGILPLWSAIQDTAKAIISSDQVVKQLLRDSGKNVRRHYKFPSTVDVAQTEYHPSSMPWPTATLNHWTNGGVAPILHTKTERSVWFDGCFTYHLPPESMEGWEGAANKARLIYGVDFSPDVIWNLLGWSWLIDWVINVGPVMNNLGLFSRDGLTLRYGYTMENTKVQQIHRSNGLRAAGDGSTPTQPALYLRGERKRRLEQTPFVLGLTDAAFTARRAAILAALGASRSR